MKIYEMLNILRDIVPIDYRNASIKECKECFNEMHAQEKRRLGGDWTLSSCVYAQVRIGAFDGKRCVGFCYGNTCENYGLITICTLKDYRHQGIAYQTAKRCIDDLKKLPGIDYILWRCHKDNKGSNALAKKLGGKKIESPIETDKSVGYIAYII